MIATLSTSIFTPRPTRPRTAARVAIDAPSNSAFARAQVWLGGGEETAYAWRDQSGTVAEISSNPRRTTDAATNSNEAAPHTPVMHDECVAAFQDAPSGWIVDGTFGAGGHTRALLEAGYQVIAIDQDPHAQAHADQLRASLTAAGMTGAAARFMFVAGNFRDLQTLCAHAGVTQVAGVLLDLGVSSMQLDEGLRGFAFRQAGPLDMRMRGSGTSAADLVRDASMEELAAILHRYGEERHSRRLARAIVEARAIEPITTTQALAGVIERAYPGRSHREHPARRTFQALRIAVNDELGALADGLDAAANLLMPGGCLAVLAYHSLEDRIVKQTIARRHDLTAAFRKPREASDAEIARNPRARSAKLRVASKRASEETA